MMHLNALEKNKPSQQAPNEVPSGEIHGHGVILLRVGTAKDVSEYTKELHLGS